ncbi:MAG: hypothetical protein M5R36_05270 [Deltaproteobacteria bacterium]|nr:hypothetical protein [Deltaproteobacteria bacterium]
MSEHDAEQGVLSAPRLDAVCDIVRTLYAAGVNLNRLPAQDPSITTAVTQVVLRFKTLLPDGDVRLGVGHGLLFSTISRFPKPFRTAFTRKPS